jgi:hypothetical protein
VWVAKVTSVWSGGGDRTFSARLHSLLQDCCSCACCRLCCFCCWAVLPLMLCLQFGAVPCIVNLAARLDVRQGVVRRLGQGVLSELEANGKVR